MASKTEQKKLLNAKLNEYQIDWNSAEVKRNDLINLAMEQENPETYIDQAAKQLVQLGREGSEDSDPPEDPPTDDPENEEPGTTNDDPPAEKHVRDGEEVASARDLSREFCPRCSDDIRGKYVYCKVVSTQGITVYYKCEKPGCGYTTKRIRTTIAKAYHRQMQRNAAAQVNVNARPEK